ncbi:Zinc finger, RING-type [Kalmanozyma brasiliensis GHG001]|uniref:RING-type domain-containing protein n=1 Tax=Kalmanozyma brasiliensis (strain GHG001) TaxID=1365824 RepID=V5E398_KALBG|nr:Zinc finger, RING-type [Kalmanozyma brasiliensis GHG001]EST04631.1 Zinc finger, RING-type [Kalmanozyma brasiliensis GHG001]
MTPDPTCPRCNGQFVEIIDETAPVNDNDADDDDGVEANYPFGALPSSRSQPFTFHTGQATAGSLPQFLGQMLSAVAAPSNAPNTSRQDASWNSQSDYQRRWAEQGPGHSQSSSTTRSGNTSFGPFGMQWNVQYGSGGGDPYQRAAQNQAEHNQRQQQQQTMGSPPTLSNFLRYAFGGADSTDNNARQEDTYFHDDGMGGAGGVADGRHFNHDNRGTYHQPPQSPNNNNAGRPHNDLPPELGALRNLFTGLFGESATQGGSLLDILAAGAQGGAGGPRGQWGDYVIGQQGLDDIISQLMEQTQGSNAPPPAEEDVIKKLERFTRKDKERIEKARNQDCPTCKDEFLPSPEAKADDDPQADDDQQEELIAMPCRHIFHVDCLVPWLRLNGTCPVCRISIAKPREDQTSATNSGRNATASQQAQLSINANASSTSTDQSVPGGWPSPPNPFTSLFGAFSNRHPNEGVHIPRESPGDSTTTYHPSPPTSTTVTSTVYPATARTGGTPGIGGGEVVNSIISSPPLVDDRAEFFEPDEPTQEHSGGREDMRETLRRAAEARARNSSNAEGAAARRGGQPTLEPDELD